MYSITDVHMIADNNLVELLDEDPMGSSSAIITIQEKSAELAWGKVVRRGPGQNADDGSLIPNPCSRGDLVLLYKRGIPTHKILGKTYSIVPLAAVTLRIPGENLDGTDQA